ncbi:hypothetical protein M446_0532 [Methylobacterium sp. 4-46]|nr:hypothetical protein M446_0532 [Methylobacterium sp. 4-46]
MAASAVGRERARARESPLRLAKPAGAGLPVTRVADTNPALAEPSRRRARSKAGWHSREPAVPRGVAVPMPGTAVEGLAGVG